MKSLTPRLAVGCLTLLACGLPANASFVISGATGEYTNGSTFTGQIVVSFAQNGSNNVKMTVDATGASDPNGADITGLYFNTAFGNPGAISATLLAGESVGSVDPFKLKAGSNNPAGTVNPSNLLLDFPPPPGVGKADYFVFGEKLVFNLTATGLTADSFLTASVAGSPTYNVIARIQNLGANNQGSGWFRNENTVQAVPAPAGLVLAVAGLPFLALSRLVRRKTA